MDELLPHRERTGREIVTDTFSALFSSLRSAVGSWLCKRHTKTVFRLRPWILFCALFLTFSRFRLSRLATNNPQLIDFNRWQMICRQSRCEIDASHWVYTKHKLKHWKREIYSLEAQEIFAISTIRRTFRRVGKRLHKSRVQKQQIIHWVKQNWMRPCDRPWTVAQTVAFSRGCETIGKQCKVMSWERLRERRLWGVWGREIERVCFLF